MINPGLREGYYAVGLQVDERQRVFVAGGWGRLITVMDGITGKVIQTYEVGNADTFVDHVVLTPRAAWFTYSFNGQLFGLPLRPRGALPAGDQVVLLKLGGEWTEGPSDGLTATGVAATPDGSALIVVNIHAHGGSLFRVAPATGDARRIDLGGVTPPTTNGILVHGRTLYAPRMNDLAVLRLDPTGHNARLARTVTDPRFKTPVRPPSTAPASTCPTPASRSPRSRTSRTTRWRSPCRCSGIGGGGGPHCSRGTPPTGEGSGTDRGGSACDGKMPVSVLVRSGSRR
ncbi:hypothetical protein OG909_13415 [Streptomyces sp. NBC_01754]|uniref:hypothetical protein n=1 Tax=Streptomyces sp. NBC_01754 TaxID=2975930 RepID=UPI002DDC77D9|nr:hypothetical protein [Streptomyces sp. NBC_01754]WSC93208.1 hypothetical protein OG909_13415 [Streptomyces sp. NBC_01754]